MLNDPLCFLKMYLKEKVQIRLNTGEMCSGVLEGFDEHINLMLTSSSLEDSEGKLVFLRGENVLFVGVSN